MRVNLAAQVFSSSVAAGLFTLARFNVLPPAAKETANLCLKPDQLFDSFNGTKVDPTPATSRKKYHCALSYGSPHLQLWVEIKLWLNSLKFKRIKNNVHISRLPFQEGWTWTINATEMLWKDLRDEGYTYLPTRSLNQDLVENLFASVRYNCGNSRTTKAEQLEPALLTSLVNMLNRSSTSKNCETDESSFLADLNLLASHGEQGAEADDMDVDEARETIAIDEDDPMQELSEENLAMEEDTAINNSTLSLSSNQGNAQIAGAALRKLTARTQNCTTCMCALTVSTENMCPTLHSTIGLKDEMRSVYMYPTQLMCTITGTVMQTGRDVLPTLLPFPKVLHNFMEKCSSKTTFHLLPFCSSLQDFANSYSGISAKSISTKH